MFGFMQSQRKSIARYPYRNRFAAAGPGGDDAYPFSRHKAKFQQAQHQGAAVAMRQIRHLNLFDYADLIAAELAQGAGRC